MDPTVIALWSVGAERRILGEMRHLVFAAVCVVLTACSWTQSHSRGGVAWNQACAAHATEGCPCQRDRDCDTLWCTAGACERREP